MILGVQFAKKMGMFDSKLRKSMWQICTASGSIENVLGDLSDLSSFESMESHGQPIKPLLRQLITWTPPKEGITL
jgi:hypothetical protein